VGVANVRQYIEKGELVAFNTSLGVLKPRWKVFEKDLESFIKSRKSTASLISKEGDGLGSSN
jgi:hypothetical protein